MEEGDVDFSDSEDDPVVNEVIYNVQYAFGKKRAHLTFSDTSIPLKEAARSAVHLSIPLTPKKQQFRYEHP